MKLLFFQMRDVCYNSYTYFSDSLAEQFIKNGHEVEFFKISEEPFENLERLKGYTYDAMIDFNSELPRALLEDDSFFLDHINAPFYDVILDHPLYHHDKLKLELKNYHVICLDAFHRDYILSYYPHIKSVNTISLTGQLSPISDSISYEDFDRRPYDLCFTGTYTAPEKIELAISKIPPFLQEDVFSIIEYMENDYSLSIEQAVALRGNEFGHDYILDEFTLHTKAFYLADAFVRAKVRRDVIKALDTPAHELHIFGGLWEELDLKYAKVHKEMPFTLAFSCPYHSKLALNVMPNFKEGGHDRIFAAQLNGAAVLTDPSISLLKEYKDGQDILFYDVSQLDTLSDRVNNLLSNPNELKKIAQAGEQKAQKNHTWTKVYEVFSKILAINQDS